jgi:hypothetical protein
MRRKLTEWVNCTPIHESCGLSSGVETFSNTLLGAAAAVAALHWLLPPSLQSR